MKRFAQLYQKAKILFLSLLNSFLTKFKIIWRFIVMLPSKTMNVSIKFFRLLQNWYFVAIKTLYPAFNRPLFYGFTITILVILIYDVFYFEIQNLFGDNENILQKLIEWIGILYSLFVSMMLVRAWERLENLGDLLANEAKELLDLLESVRNIPGTDNVVVSIKTYIDYVDQKFKDEAENVLNEAAGDKVVEAIKKEIESVLNTNPTLASLGLSQKIQNLVDIRKKRLTNSRVQISSSIMVLLFFSSILWLSLFASVAIEGVWLSHIYLGGLAFIVFTIPSAIVVFYTRRDVGWNDLSGSWKKLKEKTQV